MKRIYLYISSLNLPKNTKGNLKCALMTLLLASLILFIFSLDAFGQSVGINNTGANPNVSAILDLNTGNAGTTGFLAPQVALTKTNSANPVVTPATGLLLYNTATAGFAPDNVVPGYWYYGSGFFFGGNWLLLTAVPPGTFGQVLTSIGGGAPTWKNSASSIKDSAYTLWGNTGTNYNTNFIGTTDNNDFVFKVNNQFSGILDKVYFNTLFGYDAGASTMSGGGEYNSAFGYEALYSNTSGAGNTAMGINTLYTNTLGTYNTATGYESQYYALEPNYNTSSGYLSLYYNSGGNNNTAIGDQSLYNNLGSNNSAEGFEALFNTLSANNNTANGSGALFTNKTGNNNTAEGYYASYYNTSGINNTSTGPYALYNDSSGSNNTANGVYALQSNATGALNTANGVNALYYNVAGSSNTADGYQALIYTIADGNVGFGDSAGIFNSTGSYNTYIGYGAGNSTGLTNLTNVTCLGYNSGAAANTYGNNSMYLGNSSTAYIYSEVQSISAYSDRRIKEDIKENVPGLAFITKLRPVTYHLNIHRQNQILGVKDGNDYEGKYDIEKITQSGFIAQEVDSVARLCSYDFNGISKPQTPGGLYSLGYADFVVPLVKAVQEQEKIIDGIEAENLALTAQLNRLVKTQEQEKQSLNSRLNDKAKEIARLKQIIYSLTQRADASRVLPPSGN